MPESEHVAPVQASGPVYLVLGASGRVGSALTQTLTRAGARVRGFYEPASADRAPAGVEAVVGTFDEPAELRQAMQGVTALLMLTPPSEHQVRWQQDIIAAATATGVRRVVKVSAFDAGPASSLQLGRWHHVGEVALAESGIDHVILRPQYFMQNLLPAISEAIRTGVLAVPAPPDVRLGFVDVRDVADVAAVALTTDRFSRQALVPTGPAALGYGEVARELERAAERDISYRHMPSEEVRRVMSTRGVPAWFIEDSLKINASAASALVNGCVAEVVGRPPRAFAEFAREVVRQIDGR